jgi:serine/threonine protein kinase
MLGKILSKYKLLEIIGVGGMSTVYLGRDKDSGSLAAIKVLKNAYTQDEDHLNRFFSREIKTAKSLNHKNIVKLIDHGKEKDTYYIVYEYVNGLSLDRYLAQNKKLSLNTIENILLQILSALSHAHSKGIVHRDIKPQNILVTPEGKVKITDFGIAKALSSTTITQTGIFMGSPNYISPEQAEGKKIDGRSDLYSLGVVLFEMLTRKLPFNAETPWAIVHKHIYDKPPDISLISKKLPQYLANVISVLLSKNPRDRFSSAEEVAHIITTKSYEEPTIVKRVEKDELIKEDIKSAKKPVKINKKKLAISLGISAVIIWFIIGASFYSVGNAYYNDDEYLNAARSFRHAKIMLIPNSENSIIQSLDYYRGRLEMLLNQGKYLSVYKNTKYVKNEYPEYVRISIIEGRLDGIYAFKKKEYFNLKDQENFIQAVENLRSMIDLKGGSDNFAEGELESMEDYAMSQTYIEEAKIYLEDGNYSEMYYLIEKAEELTPNYGGIKGISSMIDNKYESLKKASEGYLKNKNFDLCLATLEDMIELKQGSDSYAHEQIDIVDQYIEATSYIDDAIRLSSQKDFDSALALLDSAMEILPDYEPLLTVYDEIKNKKENYNSYIAKINNINNLNQNGDYLNAYDQANSLLNNDIFISSVFQEDIDRLKSIKSSAYDKGKYIPGNSVSFNLQNNDQWQTKNINNVFGNKLYSIQFSKYGNFSDNNMPTGIGIAIDNYENSLILVCNSNLVRTDTGENTISSTRRDNPDCIVGELSPNGAYTLTRDGKNFIIKIDSVSYGDGKWWINSLSLTVSIQ